MKKPSLKPSSLHIQSIAEEKASLTIKVHHLLNHFERRRTHPSTWQGQQLDHALDCIADGLFSLANCELDALTEPRQALKRASLNGYNKPSATVPADRSTDPDAHRPDGKPAVTLSTLRRKLQKLSQPQQLT